MKLKQILFSISTLCLASSAIAATNINTATVNGTWTLANSPYYIFNDISVPLNESLTIQPGVEVVFMGNYAFDILGTISAVGTPEQKIIFRANDPTLWNNFNIPDGGWGGIYTYVSHFNTNVAMPAYEYCVIRDVKNEQRTVFSAHYLNVSVNHCEFFNNFAGSIINLNYFGNGAISSLKFTNNVIYNSYGGKILSTLFTDSAIIKNNKIYNNNSKYDIYYNSSYIQSTNNGVLIFEGNEMYDNHVKENAAIFTSIADGYNIIRGNKFHHNTTTLKGAVSVSSKTALIEQNLIANNSRVQKNGFFCGINDGGAGLHLLGRTVMSDEPGQNVFTVRNNIIANNHSDIDGAGIWANHCKANIVNNTIINNTSAAPGAAIHGWGQYCSINVQNNIISGNKSSTVGVDTGYYNFNFSPMMLNVNISNNLIDYSYFNAPSNILGLAQNNYDHSLTLANPTAGAGINFDATLSDFSPIATSINVINKGNNSVVDYGTKDYLGNTRIVDNIIDMGAIEYKGGGNTTSLNDINLSKMISVYPIPAQNTLQVSNESGNKIKNVQIIAVDGRQIITNYSGNHTQLNVDIRAIESGHYFLKVQFENGKLASKPFIVL